MICSLTVFSSIYDNSVDKVVNLPSFDRLENLLRALSKNPGYKIRKDTPIPDGVNPSQLISPAIYEPNSARRIKHVIRWAGWAAIDVDEYECSFEKQCKVFERYRRVIYSTASSTINKPKFRVCFPLSSDVYADDISKFWFALNKEFGSVIDAQTKDKTRIFYVPAQYPDAYNFFMTGAGEEINPFELMSKYPFVKKTTDPFDSLPDDVQRKILEYRRSKYTNVNFTWTSYKNCPFVSKRMLSEYMTIGSGWYRKSYQLMCSIACNALRQGYPVTEAEVATLFREIDAATGSWYLNRPVEAEAARAVEYALKVT